MAVAPLCGTLEARGHHRAGRGAPTPRLRCSVPGGVPCLCSDSLGTGSSCAWGCCRRLSGPLHLSWEPAQAQRDGRPCRARVDEGLPSDRGQVGTSPASGGAGSPSSVPGPGSCFLATRKLWASLRVQLWGRDEGRRGRRGGWASLSARPCMRHSSAGSWYLGAQQPCVIHERDSAERGRE